MAATTFPFPTTPFPSTADYGDVECHRSRRPLLFFFLSFFFSFFLPLLSSLCVVVVVVVVVVGATENYNENRETVQLWGIHHGGHRRTDRWSLGFVSGFHFGRESLVTPVSETSVFKDPPPPILPHSASLVGMKSQCRTCFGILSRSSWVESIRRIHFRRRTQRRRRLFAAPLLSEEDLSFVTSPLIQSSGVPFRRPHWRRSHFSSARYRWNSLGVLLKKSFFMSPNCLNGKKMFWLTRPS